MNRSSGRDAGSLYRELAPAVLGYLRGQGVDDPEDVLGEVSVQVARDLPRVEGGGSTSGGRCSGWPGTG